jgi:hypothetical protein
MIYNQQFVTLWFYFLIRFILFYLRHAVKTQIPAACNGVSCWPLTGSRIWSDQYNRRQIFALLLVIFISCARCNSPPLCETCSRRLFSCCGNFLLSACCQLVCRDKHESICSLDHLTVFWLNLFIVFDLLLFSDRTHKYSTWPPGSSAHFWAAYFRPAESPYYVMQQQVAEMECPWTAGQSSKSVCGACLHEQSHLR